jgi:S1-C subfamily serine protease
MPSKIPTETTLELGSKLRALSRRSVLRGLATAATASGAALSAAVERAYGKPPEGKVIVHTDDIYGQPDTVRVIPKERYRRLKLYERLPIQKFTDRDGVQAVTITQQSDDPTDLALKFLVENNDRATRKRVPNNYKRVPTVVEEQSVELTKEAIRGGSAIGNPNTDRQTDGTVCLVGYDLDSDTELIVTADHVMNGAENMKFSGDTVGTLHIRNHLTDTTSYESTKNIDLDPRETADSRIPNISGAWRFDGLADKVGNTDRGDSVSDGGTVDVEMFGAFSGYISDTCNNTKRGSVFYQADMKRHSTQKGDSGGPWVDANGKLLGVHHGKEEYSGDSWSVASVGRHALNSADVKLHK